MAALPLPTAPPSSVPPGSALAAVANQLAPRGLSQATTQQTPMMPQSPAMPGRTAGAPLPMPDFMAANPNYAAQTQQYQQQRLLGEQGYRPLSPGADILRQAANGATTYQQPGVTGLGGISPGSATFQGLPQGGRLGYTGTPETAGMSQQEATAYNVANLNRQTDALRSLNEARGMYGQGGGDNRAFGDLVSIGQAGGGVGDDVMARDRFMRQFDTRTRSGRQGLLQAQALFNQQAQQQAGLAGTRLPAPPSGDLYKLAQLGIDQRKMGLDQLKFGLDQQNQQFNQGQTAALNQSLIAQRAADGLPKPPTQNQVMGNIANDYYMTLQASRDPRLSEQERAGAVGRLGMLHDVLGTLGAQQKQQNDFEQLNELVRKNTNGMR